MKFMKSAKKFIEVERRKCEKNFCGGGGDGKYFTPRYFKFIEFFIPSFVHRRRRRHRP